MKRIVVNRASLRWVTVIRDMPVIGDYDPAVHGWRTVRRIVPLRRR